MQVKRRESVAANEAAAASDVAARAHAQKCAAALAAACAVDADLDAAEVAASYEMATIAADLGSSDFSPDLLGEVDAAFNADFGTADGAAEALRDRMLENVNSCMTHETPNVNLLTVTKHGNIIGNRDHTKNTACEVTGRACCCHGSCRCRRDCCHCSSQHGCCCGCMCF